MLDPVHPSHLQSAFDEVLGALRRHGGLVPFQKLSGRVLQGDRLKRVQADCRSNASS
jgi:hypothetical protein